jgi:uncharacterized protein (DUF1810 family)
MLQRFKQAQDQAQDGFAAALAELKAGRKTGHWIWYIFPQLSGLGSSPAATIFGISDVREALDYLRDPILRERLLVAATTVAERLRDGVKLATLMGSRIDVLKLISSMTLFGAAAAKSPADAGADDQRLAEVAEEILKAAEAEGYHRCAFTLDRLRASRDK